MTVYKLIEVVGTSGTSIDEAIQGAIERTRSSVEDLQWFEVKEIRGRIKDDHTEYQVKMDIGFTVHAPRQSDRRGTLHAEEAPASRKARSTTGQLVAKKGGRTGNDRAKGFEKQRRK